MIKYTELWNEYLIKTINSGEAGEYRKDYMRPVFQEDSKYYPQVLLEECLYEL